MDTGAKMGMDDNSPRIAAEIWSRLGSIDSTLKAQSKLTAAVYRACYGDGNGRKGLLRKVDAVETKIEDHKIILDEHDKMLSKLMIESKAGKLHLRKHTVKVAGWTTTGITALLIALKLVMYLITRDSAWVKPL